MSRQEMSKRDDFITEYVTLCLKHGLFVLPDIKYTSTLVGVEDFPEYFISHVGQLMEKS
jgi:hypothetical protein